MIILAKIFAAFLALLVISKTLINFKKGEETLVMFVFWTTTWVLIVAVALFPNIIDLFISWSHGEKIGVGTFMGMAIVFLFFVIYRVYIKANRIEKKLTELIRTDALSQIKQKNK